MLVAVGIELAGQTECGKLAATRGRKRVLALDAVEIAVKHAGVAFRAEKDEAVCERFKKGLNGRFKSLVGLGVMVPIKLGHVWCGRDGRNEHHQSLCL